MDRRIPVIIAAVACTVAATLELASPASGAMTAPSMTARSSRPAVLSSAAARHEASLPAAPGTADPSSTVTFTVTTGALSITVPVSVSLGSGSPGTTIGPTPMGALTVTDNRAALNATWTVTASSTDFTTGGGTAPETIPATAESYTVGIVTTTGTLTPTGSSITLSGTSQTVVTTSAINGDNTASWNPALSVAVPASAVGGLYTATLTHSVS